MADEKAPVQQTPIDPNTVARVELAPEGQSHTFESFFDGKNHITSTLSDSDSLTVDTDEVREAGKEQPTEGEQDPSASEQSEDSEATDALEETPAEATTEDDLPADFEGELTPELLTKYETKYTKADEAGNPMLNLEAFNAEADVVRKREDGSEYFDLNPGTKKFLNSLGVSNAIIEQHLAGYVAQKQQFADHFHSQFGADAKDGKANYDKMVDWARDGGFTPEQRARFNAGLQEGGEAATEQLELLKTRYLVKNPQGLSQPTQEQRKAQLGLRKEGRSASPARSATSGTTSPSAPATFANAEEHRLAQKEALSMRGADRDKALEVVHKKLQASTFWRA